MADFGSVMKGIGGRVGAAAKGYQSSLDNAASGKDSDHKDPNDMGRKIGTTARKMVGRLKNRGKGTAIKARGEPKYAAGKIME